ncbi:hypothetical protein R1sor_006774 [Riccia sorocarpa]|uniref:Uncharacterized protein n=1 Tax=Riccia sorocarpa TaxID=122646 RepID=A0ABD3HNE0_9MARC
MDTRHEADPLSEEAIQQAAAHITVSRDRPSLQRPTSPVDLTSGHAVSLSRRHLTHSPLRTHIPIKLGVAEVAQPIRYLSLGDPCPHCGYPPHEDLVCPPPPVYPTPPDDDDAPAVDSQVQGDPTEDLSVHRPPQLAAVPDLSRCSPPLRRAYVHRQGVTPARSAPTRTDYAITHGFPTGAPRYPPLDLNQDPQLQLPAPMEVEVEADSIGDQLSDTEVMQQLGDQEITQQE